MSAVPSLVPTAETGPRRNSPRYAINVPLDVITLRSGIPDSIPGRCTNISESGIGAAVAGELAVNQHVGIELKLPQVALPLRARAIVRHHYRLHCGLQFVNLSVEQREMIRFWAHRNAAQPPSKAVAEVTVSEPDPPVVAASPRHHGHPRRIRIGKRRLFVLLAVVLALAVCAWWYWERAWRQLESSGSTAMEPQAEMPQQVAADAVQRSLCDQNTPMVVILSAAKDLFSSP